MSDAFIDLATRMVAILRDRREERMRVERRRARELFRAAGRPIPLWAEEPISEAELENDL